MIFSEKLALLRRKKGLSQEQLAEMLDVSRQSVSKWEAQQTLPELNKIILLSEIFEVSIDQLLKDDLDIEEDTQEIKEYEPAEIVSDEVKLGVIFCTKCGKENRADSAFCGYCGNPFTSFVTVESDTGQLTKTDMELAYYKANLQMQQMELEEAQKQTEQQRQQLMLQREQYDRMLKCPRCGSTSLSGNKKGYGIGKGVIGAAVLGPFGLVAGNIGSGKVKVTCMKCGYKFGVWDKLKAKL